MFNWFKDKKPKYVEGHYSSWCAIKFVNGKVEPELRVFSNREKGCFSTTADVGAVLKWITKRKG